MKLMPWKKDRNGSTALATRTADPMSLFRSEFDTLFDRFFGNWPMLDGGWSGVAGLDIDETDAEVIVRCDAPGFEPDDFDIQVSGDTLKVTAERTRGKGKEAYAERHLHRVISLPAAVDADKVEANYRHGVLELKLPKTEQAKWKKIQVKAA